MALSATYRKTYKQNMYILISYIQVKNLVADTLYTIFVYCIFVYTGKKCVSYLTFYLYIRNKNKHILYIQGEQVVSLHLCFYRCKETTCSPCTYEYQIIGIISGMYTKTITAGQNV